jgi:hypothetical protein
VSLWHDKGESKKSWLFFGVRYVCKSHSRWAIAYFCYGQHHLSTASVCECLCKWICRLRNVPPRF